MHQLKERTCGILLHPTSLPGPHGIGSLGKEARAFIDFLRQAKQTYWQVLPLGPTGYGDSPYACFSSLAGNPLLIDLETLVSEGLLNERDLEGSPGKSAHVDFGAVVEFKQKALQKATRQFAAEATAAQRTQFYEFSARNARWLNDYALFRAIKTSQGERAVSEWPLVLRNRQSDALSEAAETLSDAVQHEMLVQHFFFQQWHALREYAHAQGIRIMGDMPIFVALDSDAVWSRPHLFKLDERLHPSVVAGVPPDYFSETGQLWGNPLYDWNAHREEGFAWWIERMQMALELADVIRLDHFRGFAAAWEIPAGDANAIRGHWEPGPGQDLFLALRKRFEELPLVAEDLGLITDDVHELRRELGIPGMHVLQFGFGASGDRLYAPHRAEKDCVVYTGTHDNDTTLGWYQNLEPQDRALVEQYLGASNNQIPWAMVRAAYQTLANTVIVPMQDVLGLDSAARMNMPGQLGPWWSFRLLEQPSEMLATELAKLASLYERTGETPS